MGLTEIQNFIWIGDFYYEKKINCNVVGNYYVC